MSRSAKARKIAHRKAWQETLVRGQGAELMSTDPLVHGRIGLSQLLVLGPLAVCAAVGAHVLFTGAVWLASDYLKEETKKKDEEIIIVQIPDPPPLDPEPAAAEVKVEEAETKVESEPEPPKPNPPKEKPKPPPETQPEPPKPAEPPPANQPPPRKITGLNLGSTVAGGTGPSFAVGNSLDGATGTTAVDPNRAAATPAEGSDPNGQLEAPKENRVATRIPQEGVKLVKPRPLTRVKPEYPPKLRAQEIEGNVVVEVQIDSAGRVTAASIIKPSEYPELNEQALVAARKETFSPATRDGKAIPFTITYTIRFRLDD